MRFTNKTVLALLAQAFVALGADNSFNVPEGGYNATAGQSLALSWSPTTSGTVSLILRSGASSDLDAGTYIAQSIQNSGSYTWNLPSDITRGSDYAIEIVDDSNSSITNYTPYFVIDSTVTVASSTSQITLGASATASPSSSGVISGTTTGSSASSAISSVASRASSQSASIASVASSLSSASGSVTSSASRSASSSASAASASASSSHTTVSNSGAAATAMPILLGVVAMGAFAL